MIIYISISSCNH